MVDVTYQMVLSTLQTAGILVGIFYYITILRNQQKNQKIEMVSLRAQQANNFEYQKMVREIQPMAEGWTTAEEYSKKYNYLTTPELALSRFIIQNNMNHLSFLFKEGVIGEDYIDRLYNPWHIIKFWEEFSPLWLDEREKLGNPEHLKDYEYLYNALKKKYPNLSAKTKFAFTHWIKE